MLLNPAKLQLMLLSGNRISVFYQLRWLPGDLLCLPDLTTPLKIPLMMWLEMNGWVVLQICWVEVALTLHYPIFAGENILSNVTGRSIFSPIFWWRVTEAMRLSWVYLYAHCIFCHAGILWQLSRWWISCSICTWGPCIRSSASILRNTCIVCKSLSFCSFSLHNILFRYSWPDVN